MFCGNLLKINNMGALNLSGSYSPKLASFVELLPTLRYPAACCGEVHFDLFIINYILLLKEQKRVANAGCSFKRTDTAIHPSHNGSIRTPFFAVKIPLTYKTVLLILPSIMSNV